MKAAADRSLGSDVSALLLTFLAYRPKLPITLDVSNRGSDPYPCGFRRFQRTDLPQLSTLKVRNSRTAVGVLET